MNLGRDGYESSCDASGKCWIVWSGDVDISSDARSKARSSASRTSRVRPDVVLGLRDEERDVRGVRRLRALLVRATETRRRYPGPFNDIQLIPFLTTANGARLYDHNRNAAPFANYVLDAADSYAIAQDGSCPAVVPTSVATVQFGMPWTTTQRGPILQGGELDVDYAIARLPQCQGDSEDGVAAWDIVANALFTPGGQPMTSVFQPPAPGNALPSDFLSSFTVPKDATGVQLWFWTSGDGCVTIHYDSSYGANYRFPVAAKAPSAPVAWAGDWAARSIAAASTWTGSRSRSTSPRSRSPRRACSSTPRFTCRA